jgi:hypothetical protein
MVDSKLYHSQSLLFDSKLSNSKYLSFIRLKAKAAALALKTEKSNAPFIPVEKVIDKPNSNKSKPLNFAVNSVLNPTRRKIAKSISAAVAIIPIAGIRESGSQGFITRVYSRKLLQFPQTETSARHIPNLSATADKNPAAIANRKNNFTPLSINY